MAARVAGAAQAKLRSEALASFLHDWQDEHGHFTPEELAWAVSALRLPRDPQ